MKKLNISLEVSISGSVEEDYDFYPEDFIKDLKTVILDLLTDRGKDVRFGEVEIKEAG